MGSSGGGIVGSFLQNDININDPAVLRKRISELELENKNLKDSSQGGSLGSKGGFSSMSKG